MADDRALCRAGLVQRRTGSCTARCAPPPVLRRLGQDLADDVGERVERLARLGLGRLDQQRLVDEQREVDRRRVIAEVQHPLGEVERADPERLLHRPAREHELVHARAVIGRRQVLPGVSASRAIR